jgi:hypothetical protein
MLNVEWSAALLASIRHSAAIQHSTLNIQHSTFLIGTQAALRNTRP